MTTDNFVTALGDQFDRLDIHPESLIKHVYASRLRGRENRHLIVIIVREDNFPLNLFHRVQKAAADLVFPEVNTLQSTRYTYIAPLVKARINCTRM